MILLSLGFNGILFISEEVLFSKFVINPCEVVGTEGCWGVLLYAILLPIMSLMPCGGDALKDVCVYSGNGIH